ncbi:hypothetical protein MXB_1291 [Myxobolus squamalis]|nr:hypothetical protein MXB_1291 [Myxobolus squamalis]
MHMISFVIFLSVQFIPYWQSFQPKYIDGRSSSACFSHCGFFKGAKLFNGDECML